MSGISNIANNHSYLLSQALSNSDSGGRKVGSTQAFSIKAGSTQAGEEIKDISALLKNSGSAYALKITPSEMSKAMALGSTVSKMADKIAAYINKIDTNNDGCLDLNEIGINPDMFEKLDINNDNVLDLDEIADSLGLDRIPQRRQNMIERYISNSDEPMDLQSLGLDDKMVKRIDRNGNGSLEAPEIFKAYRRGLLKDTENSFSTLI